MIIIDVFEAYYKKGSESSWTPQQFHNYIVENADDIRLALQDPKLTLGDLLDAICLGSYERYIEQYEEECFKRLRNINPIRY